MHSSTKIPASRNSVKFLLMKSSLWIAFILLGCVIVFVCNSHFSLLFVFEIKSDFTQSDSCILKTRFFVLSVFGLVHFDFVFLSQFAFRHIVSLINRWMQWIKKKIHRQGNLNDNPNTFLMCTKFPLAR